MLTVRSEIGPLPKATQRFYREASHSAKALSVRKKRLPLPIAFHSWGYHKDGARTNIDNYFFKFSDKRLTRFGHGTQVKTPRKALSEHTEPNLHT
jgi:hypothetical protein